MSYLPKVGWRVGVPPTWHRFTADGLQNFDLRHNWWSGERSNLRMRVFTPPLGHLSYHSKP